MISLSGSQDRYKITISTPGINKHDTKRKQDLGLNFLHGDNLPLTVLRICACSLENSDQPLWQDKQVGLSRATLEFQVKVFILISLQSQVKVLSRSPTFPDLTYLSQLDLSNVDLSRLDLS